MNVMNCPEHFSVAASLGLEIMFIHRHLIMTNHDLYLNFLEVVNRTTAFYYKYKSKYGTGPIFQLARDWAHVYKQLLS